MFESRCSHLTIGQLHPSALHFGRVTLELKGVNSFFCFFFFMIPLKCLNKCNLFVSDTNECLLRILPCIKKTGQPLKKTSSLASVSDYVLVYPLF